MANIGWGLLLADVQPSRTPGLALHPALLSQGLGPSWGQDSDFVLVECQDVLTEPVLLAALPSGVWTAPSPCSWLLGEGVWYQKLTQKEKFSKLLQPIAVTRVRRLTNVDDISSLLSLLEKTSCKCKHVTHL